MECLRTIGPLRSTWWKNVCVRKSECQIQHHCKILLALHCTHHLETAIIVPLWEVIRWPALCKWNNDQFFGVLEIQSESPKACSDAEPCTLRDLLHELEEQGLADVSLHSQSVERPGAGSETSSGASSNFKLKSTASSHRSYCFGSIQPFAQVWISTM